MISKTKREKNQDNEFKNKLFIPSEAHKTFYRSTKHSRNGNKGKVDELGRAYMTEYSRFKYKVDAIVNDAYLYVKDLNAQK